MTQAPRSNAPGCGWRRRYRSQLQRAEAGGERGGGAARGAARRPAEIPGVVGRAIDRIEALPIRQHQRHIGLAEEDGARLLEPLDGERVVWSLTLSSDRPRSSARQRRRSFP